MRSEEANVAGSRRAPSVHFSRVQDSPEHSHSVPESPASFLWTEAGAPGAGAGRVDGEGRRAAGGRDASPRTHVGRPLGCRLENHTRSRSSIDQLQGAWGGGKAEKGRRQATLACTPTPHGSRCESPRWHPPWLSHSLFNRASDSNAADTPQVQPDSTTWASTCIPSPGSR